MLRRKNKQTTIPPHDETKHVLVIGAGLAGLAAAKKLVEESNHSVIVLEARDRIGGRLWTSERWEGFPVDLGASWIHGVNGNPLTALAKKIGATLCFTSYHRSEMYDGATGQPLSSQQESRMQELKKEMMKIIRKAQNSDTDATIRTTVQPLLERFAEDSEERRFIEFLFQSEFETEYAGSVDELSAYWYDNDKEYRGGDALLEKGYRGIVDHLSEGLQIELEQVVTELYWQEEPEEGSPAVRVVTSQSEFIADAVIVTLPLGVLQQQKVLFSPRLPHPKETAIAHLGMGLLNKCYLRFAEPFWSEKVDWIECVSDGTGMWTEWVSLLRSTKAPVLLGFNAGHYAKRIEQWTDQQTVESAMTTLRTVFGESIPDPIDYLITRWANDPYSCGSYSYNAVGSHPAMRKALATPICTTLFFAGEATEHNYPGTAHGAYGSGLRAAADLIRCTK